MTPSDQSSAFAARLKSLRVARGYRSVRAFALACGLSPTAVQNIFNGTTLPNSTTLKKIADAQRVSLNWLILGDGEMVIPEFSRSLNDGSPYREDRSDVFPAALVRELVLAVVNAFGDYGDTKLPGIPGRLEDGTPGCSVNFDQSSLIRLSAITEFGAGWLMRHEEARSVADANDDPC